MTQAETRRFGNVFNAAEITSDDDEDDSASKIARKVATISSSMVAFVADGDRILSPEKHPRARMDSKKLPPDAIRTWKYRALAGSYLYNKCNSITVKLVYSKETQRVIVVHRWLFFTGQICTK